MTDKLFARLWNDALEQPNADLFIAEYGCPDWFDEISTNPNELIIILLKIHETAHMSVREILSVSGLTQSAFSEKFCIPKRTVENWATGTRKCPDYLRLSFCRQLGIVD